MEQFKQYELNVLAQFRDRLVEGTAGRSDYEQFLSIVYPVLPIDFDWPRWDGRATYTENPQAILFASLDDCLKLLLSYVRLDRMEPGTLVSMGKGQQLSTLLSRILRLYGVS